MATNKKDLKKSSKKSNIKEENSKEAEPKDSYYKNKLLDLSEEIKKLKKENKAAILSEDKYKKYIDTISKKLKESENERSILEKKYKNALTEKEILKTKIKNIEENFKKQIEEKIKQSKKNQQKENEEKRSNLNLLKEIKKQTADLKKRQEAILKEQEKLNIIKKSVEDSARSMMSSISKGTITPSKSDGSIIPEMGSDDEKRIVHLAGLLSTAMQTKREEETKDSKKETVLDILSSEEENRLNKAADKLEAISSAGFENKDLNDLKKRSFTIIDKIENSRVEINQKDTFSDSANNQGGSLKQIEEAIKTQIHSAEEKYSKDKKENTKTKLDKESSLIQPIVNVTLETPKEESSKLSKPETSLRPASEIPTMNMKLIDDTDQYEKKLVITYGFENMPENMSYSKYKKILRNAARITLLGNLHEGLEMFKLVYEQNLPAEYKEMIAKNIQDITYYLRGLHRVRMQ